MRLPFPSNLVIAFAAIPILAACGSARYPKNYVLSLPTAARSITPAAHIPAALAIQEFQCPQYLCEGRIVYRPSSEEIGFYEFHRWAMNPGEMITQFIADSIVSEGLFKIVTLQKTGVEPAYVLRGNIERLEEEDRGSDVRVVCTISAELLDTQTKSIVWSHTASQTVAVQNRNMAGVVSSLSAAVQMTVDDLVKSLAKTLPSASSQ
jgi:ABC-type uncharacterized transport system auxiliary subunit